MKPVTTTSQAETRADAARAPVLPNYVGGRWQPASGSDTLEDSDPASGEVVALVPLSVRADVDAAVQAARAAQPAWRAVAPQRRGRAIMRLRQELWARREELGRLVTDDMGKALDDALGEVGRGIESVEAACAIPHLLKGENLEGVASGVDVEQVRQPVGVVAAITPFNFPAMIPLWFLPFALACGNGFVLKPSERDPRPAQLIFEVIDAIEEIPPGICNLVNGTHDAVNALLDHPGVDAISFVGQASTARYVSERAAATGKRVPGVGRCEELARRDARRRPRADRLGDHGLGVRRRRTAVPRRIGRGAGGRRRAPGRGSRRPGRGGFAAAGRGRGRREHGRVPSRRARCLRERLAAALEPLVGRGREVVLDGRDADAGPGGHLLGPTIVDGVDRGSRARARGAVRTAPDPGEGPETSTGALEFVNGARGTGTRGRSSPPPATPLVSTDTAPRRGCSA